MPAPQPATSVSRTSAMDSAAAPRHATGRGVEITALIAGLALLLPFVTDVVTAIRLQDTPSTPGPLDALPVQATLAAVAVASALALVVCGRLRGMRTLVVIGVLAMAPALARAVGLTIVEAESGADSGARWFSMIWLVLFGGLLLAPCGLAGVLSASIRLARLRRR